MNVSVYSDLMLLCFIVKYTECDTNINSNYF